MKMPKIEFKIMSLEENIDTIKWAYYEDDGVLSVHDYTIQCFPELSNLNGNLSQEEVYKIIEQVVGKNYKKYEESIKKEVLRYNILWKKYNDIYFNELSNYLEIEWPADLEIIEGKVGLIPVFPRDLDNFNFSIAPGLDDEKLIEVCAHETLHFLWFEKWKSIYPKIPRSEYETPYITWQYSEMVTDPILNNKPFSDIFDFKEYGYDSFYEIYDNEILVMDKLREIFSENIPINEKIDRGYEYIKNILESKTK